MTKMQEAFADDAGIAEFIDMARSANVYFDIIHGRLTVRAINPDWKVWRPIRYFLDEIGIERVERYLRSVRSDTVH